MTKSVKLLKKLLKNIGKMYRMPGYYRNLEEGQIYSMSIRNSYISDVKFVKVTPKGFNFLNLDRNKLVFRRHLYLSKKTNKFYISLKLNIKKKCQ